jgi:hypothetical protein
MRHFGHSVGHLEYRTRRPQDSDDSEFESATMVDADLVSDSDSVSDSDTSREQGCDIEVDNDSEEEGELEGDTELESDIDCDSASTIASDSDGYTSF